MTLRKIIFSILVFSLTFVSCKIRKQDPAEPVLQASKMAGYRTVPDITENDIYWHISVLASDSMQGRRSASPNEVLAAEYIKERFKSLELKPFNDDFLQNFPVTVTSAITSKSDPCFSQNVVAYYEANDSIPESDYIVIGAHYDHIGTQTDGEIIQIYNGADDNASGVAGILEIAEKMIAEGKLKYNVIFVAFGAEELGLVGSNYFCNNPPVPLEKIKLMVNLDMIGRMDSNNSVYINTGKPDDRLSALVDAIKDSHPDLNTTFSFDFIMMGSDHTPFHNKNIPVLFFITGLHSDYHKPTDTIDAINFKGTKLLLDFVYDLVISPAMDDCIRSFTSSEVNP